MKYGPQTAEIEALIQKIEGVTEKQAEELGFVVWNQSRWGARNAAWDVAWRVVREDCWNPVRKNIWESVQKVFPGVAQADIQVDIQEAASDAVLALLAEDLIN